MATEIKTWTGEARISWRVKINPLWWFGNREGLDPAYKPDWPLWQRQVFWFFRNFMFNFFRYVIGFEDRTFVVEGDAPVFLTVWHEAEPRRTGWKTALIYIGPFAFPFVSYTGKRVVWYVGWLPSGGRLGAKWNLIKPS